MIITYESGPSSDPCDSPCRVYECFFVFVESPSYAVYIIHVLLNYVGFVMDFFYVDVSRFLGLHKIGRTHTWTKKMYSFQELTNDTV